MKYTMYFLLNKAWEIAAIYLIPLGLGMLLHHFEYFVELRPWVAGFLAIIYGGGIIVAVIAAFAILWLGVIKGNWSLCEKWTSSPALRPVIFAGLVICQGALFLYVPVYSAYAAASFGYLDVTSMDPSSVWMSGVGFLIGRIGGVVMIVYPLVVLYWLFDVLWEKLMCILPLKIMLIGTGVALCISLLYYVAPAIVSWISPATWWQGYTVTYGALIFLAITVGLSYWFVKGNLDWAKRLAGEVGALSNQESP